MSVPRRLAVWLFALIVAPVAARPAEAVPCWYPPIVAPVADPYREPPCPWCAGNRGLEYRVGRNVLVRAAASGRVEFVGAVADVRYVVVRLVNGWRHTYGHLTSTSITLGDPVVAGASIGRVTGTFFFGLRIGDDYADPAPFIGERRGRPRLIPLDGRPGRPSPSAHPRCPSSDERRWSGSAVRSSVPVVAGAR